MMISVRYLYIRRIMFQLNDKKFLPICTGEVEMSFLHPHGQNSNFHYPSRPDLLTIDCRTILTIVNPTTATGRSYALSKEEMMAAIQLLQEQLNR